MRIGRIALGVLLSSLLPCAILGADRAGIKRSAEAFYSAYRQAEPAGVPTGKDLARYRSVVSKPLFALLERAGAAEADYATATKNESPPLVEGDLFTSLFEGASRYGVEECHESGPSGTCRVELTYFDANAGKPEKWHDTVFLVLEGGAWRVSDIEYGGTWEFMHKGRLTEVLAGVIKDSRIP